MNKSSFVKNFITFNEILDFNFISNLVNKNNFESSISSNWMESFILESVFKIKNVQNDFFFKEMFLLLNNNYNKEKNHATIDLYFSMVSGSKSITHKDDYDVLIIGMYGKTLYIVEEEEFIVEPGDLLSIPKNKLHKAMGISPRIIASYGVNLK